MRYQERLATGAQWPLILHEASCAESINDLRWGSDLGYLAGINVKLNPLDLLSIGAEHFVEPAQQILLGLIFSLAKLVSSFVGKFFDITSEGHGVPIPIAINIKPV